MKASHGMMAALIAAHMLAGCHKKTDSGTTTTVRTADGTAVIRTGIGSEADMPAGLPLYPGAKIGSDTVIAKDSGSKAGVITFESRDAPDAVTAFYKHAATQAGYTIAGEMKAGDAQLLSGKKADGTGFHLTVNRDGGGVTQVTMLAGTGD
jgi:hypothetical protein